MSEEQKKQLQTQLWNIANELRGKMNADEFRDYILGFIFYKYLSEKITIYADEILESDKKLYKDLDENVKEDSAIVEAVQKATVDALGYFLKPSELFHRVANNGARNGNLIEQLERTLNSIEQSTMGHDSEDDFDKLFSELDLNATKLGKTVQARNELIAKILIHLDKIDFKLQDSKVDVLGDAYEYLISQFASGAGKKAGEFYTPQEVSTVLAKIVTSGKKQIKNVYDPTCGSGSLLLRVARQVESVGMFFGQEMNNTTYNLARMNMILHDVNFSQFNILQEDTIAHPQHLDYRFEAIVANPPFSQDWAASPILLNDDRFGQYGVLAPKSYEDFAFIQHMIYQLDDSGVMATVMSLGVLFREGSEGIIRRYLVESKNYLDAVIGLPSNLFYGTPVPACILVFKKCRTNPKDILFINSTRNFQKMPRQNKLREEDIEKIVATYNSRDDHNNFSRKVSLEEIKDNDYNLNITRYVDNFEKRPRIDIDSVTKKIQSTDSDIKDIDGKISQFCNELGIATPSGANVTLLREFKKGMMQRLFTQELRFKDDNGKPFEEWRKSSLRHEFDPYKGSGIAKDDVYEDGKYPCVLYGELYTRYAEVIDAVVSRTDYDGKVKSIKGDLLIPCSTTTTGIDLANVTYLNQEGVLLGGDITILRPRKSVLGIFYAYYLTHFKTIEIAKYAQGSTIIHLYYKHIKNIEIDVPETEEQRKIADFILVLDAKIMFVEKGVEQAKNFKMAHLQQMFL
jgi:type I restriction enzyme M protein